MSLISFRTAVDKYPKRLGVILGLGLSVLTVAVFYQVHAHQFINYDDGIYIVENQHVTGGLSLDNVRWALTGVYAGFWHPLTWLSHMLDVELFGLNPAGHHLTSLFFHILNAILLFVLLLQMTRDIWPSAIVAALFAVHPLHVESVVWAAERKDVLSTFFWMLTLEAYVLHVRSPSAGRHARVIFFFILGLMSKPMLVTLPFVLLLMDVWPLRRLNFRDGQTIRLRISEKIPLILIAVAFSALAFFAQEKTGALSGFDRIPMIQRAANAMVSTVAYMENMFWPSGLVVFYPHPEWSLSFLRITGSGILILAMTVLAVRFAEKAPYLFVGWFWYTITLLPVLGFVQLGSHGMADRYTYVPLIGLFFIVVWAMSDLTAGRLWRAPLMGIISIAALVSLSAASWKQIGHWKNSVTLFEHVLRVMPDNWLAHTNLGNALYRAGDHAEAVRHFEAALAVKPSSAKTHYNMALAMDRAGVPDKALEHYLNAITYNPGLYKAHNNLGDLLSRLGRLDEAIQHYREALRINPDHANAHNNLGNALIQQLRPEEAIAHYLDAIRIYPKFILAWYNLAEAYALTAQTEKSIEAARRAVTLAEAAGDPRLIAVAQKRLTAYQTAPL